MIDRVALDDDSFISIEPRPISPIPEFIPTPITSPEPPLPQADPVQEIVTATITPYTYLRPLPQHSDAEGTVQTESAVL